MLVRKRPVYVLLEKGYNGAQDACGVVTSRKDAVRFANSRPGRTWRDYVPNQLPGDLLRDMVGRGW